MAKTAHELQLETLLEVHSENELDYAGENIDMVGVNNRNGVGKLFAGHMVICHNRFNPKTFCIGYLLYGRHAVINGYNKLYPLGVKLINGRAGHTVPLCYSVGDIIHNIGAVGGKV